jgi:hypothetical protein
MPLLTIPNPLWLWLIVGSFATWRIASIIHSERIAKPFRSLFGVIETEETTMYPDTFFGHLIECFYCVSVWVGLGTTVVLFLYPYVLIPFAMSAVAIWIHECFNR